MRDVYVAGAAGTAFGKYLDRNLRSLAEEAVAAALADAGATAAEVEAVFFANAGAGLITGQEMIRGQSALRGTGLLGIPIINVENACASGSTAFNLAWMSVASGATEVAIAVGAEKMTHPDKRRTFAAFNGAVDQNEFAFDADGSQPSQSLFMDLYAGLSRDYAERSSASPEDFAAIAVKSRRNAAHNPKAQYRDPVTVQEVMASRVIADPLRLLTCSPIGDGAAALVLASERGLGRLEADPVEVLASVVLSRREGESHEVNAVTRAAAEAYHMAGIEADEIDLVELHDAAAPAELIVAEELGLAEPGEAVERLRDGDFALDGDIPLNPSGGLLSKGHPIGATGCSQIVEIADQLRGRCGGRQVTDARVGLAENGGGWLDGGPAVATITVLGR